MFYHDRIYGSFKINEPVILDLINNSSLQRLKGIDQAGYFEPYLKASSHSRFEHSLGVMLLLRKFHASLEEQIAGLIHDVSHSAFSHCIDYALKQGSPKKHDHQDNIFKSFIKHTDIPKILKKYGFNVNFILNDKNFTLKEKKLPDLCADRLDYSLRTAAIYIPLPKKILNKILNNLMAEKGQWFFKDFTSAKTYANLFNRLNKDFYSGFPSATMFQTVGDWLKHALSKKYINFKDLYQTDKFVIKKINKHLSKDKQLKIYWLRMNAKIKAINNPKEYDVKVYVKSRLIDPLFKKGNKLVRLSAELPSWEKVIASENKPKEYFLKFLI